MTPRFILANIHQFVQLTKQKPELLSLDSFKILKPALDKANASPGGCSACKAKSLLVEHKGLFEAAISTIQPGDQTKIKEILQTKEICYYIKNEAGLVLKCF